MFSKEITQREKPFAPILRWAGSKRRLLPILQTYWRKHHKRYLEPFVGSASLFFALNPPRAILGDRNEELISSYVEIKYRVADVLHELSGLSPTKEAFYKMRGISPCTLSKPARAARFIYLNRFCFNGLYRTNLQGAFNVPYGADKSGSLPSAEILLKCSRRLKNVRLMNADFEQVLSYAEKGDLVYMDPPYAVEARRVFREYDASIFSTVDVHRLRAAMKRLDTAGISFLVSYAESDEADILRKGFDSHTVTVRRNIAGFAAHRKLSNEVLISNT